MAPGLKKTRAKCSEKFPKVIGKKDHILLGFLQRYLDRSVHRIQAVTLSGQDLIFSEWSDIFIH